MRSKRVVVEGETAEREAREARPAGNLNGVGRATQARARAQNDHLERKDEMQIGLAHSRERDGFEGRVGSDGLDARRTAVGRY